MKRPTLTIFFLVYVLIVSAQEKIHFYEDTLKMKFEIIKHIPIGSNIEKATDVLKKNKLKYELKNNAAFSSGSVSKSHIDYIYCDYNKTGKNWVSKRWQFALVHKNGKITDVLVSFGLIGP